MPFLRRKNICVNSQNGKDKQHADMGLSCIFEYHNTKGSPVADLGQRSIFRVLHPLEPIRTKPRLGCGNILNRRLELVCDDGSYDHLVLGKPAVG